MKRALVIGITADWAGATNHGRFREPTVFLHDRYCREVERAGALPLILPPNAKNGDLDIYLDQVGGLLVTGGDFDIHPRYYGERPGARLGNIIPQRTEFELALTKRALDRDLPVLGICGGAQAINVVLGGSLYQDIETQIPHSGEHQLGAIKERGGHRIQISAKTILVQAVERRSIEVNSTHHQSVKELGRGLIASARGDDGVIEAIESTRHKFVLGVQWHPEVLAPRRADQRRIFSAFISACKRIAKIKSAGNYSG